VLECFLKTQFTQNKGICGFYWDMTKSATKMRASVYNFHLRNHNLTLALI